MNGGRLKDKLASRELAIGSWITFADPSVAEIMAAAGFDWLTIDMEHSGIGISQAQDLIRVVSLCGVPALVRLSSNDPVLAKRVLDAGAAGTVVPMVNTATDAARAVAAARYPPRGMRSVGLWRAQGYGVRFAEYLESAATDVIVIVQIEHIDAVENLEAILDVEGIDGIIIGPYDLSASMGVPGRFDLPHVREALDRVASVAAARNVPAGLHFVKPDPAEAVAAVARGFRFVAYSADFLLLGDTCRSGVASIRQAFRTPLT